MKYVSRKFVLSVAHVILIPSLPVLYHRLGISDDVCKIVMAALFGTNVYHIVNLLEGRIGDGSDKQS